jgi:hypothetical protein
MSGIKKTFSKKSTARQPGKNKKRINGTVEFEIINIRSIGSNFQTLTAASITYASTVQLDSPQSSTRTLQGDLFQVFWFNRPARHLQNFGFP